jgi:hypothetical protein
MKKIEEKIWWLNERIIELQNEKIVRNQFLEELIEIIEVRKIENEEYCSFLKDPEHKFHLESNKYNNHSQIRLENLIEKIDQNQIVLGSDEKELLEIIITNPLFEVNEKIW